MALPGAFGTITIIGTFTDYLGVAGIGTVTFSPPAGGFIKVDDPTGNTDVLIVPKDITATLAADGTFSVVVPLTDDPDIAPSFFYTVTANVSGTKKTWQVEVPTSLLPGPINLADLVPVGNVPLDGTTLTVETGDTRYFPVDHFLILSATAPIPPGTPAGTFIFRTAS
jgi:hypothetical protein